jgi:PAS domain S-box-containing protein
MNSLVTNLLSLRRIEYLIIDYNLNILEMSVGVSRFDIYNSAQLGKDVRLVFPGLAGLENIFEEIIQGVKNNFELKGIMHSAFDSNASLTNDSLLYIDIGITKNLQEDSSNDELMIILEDVTERMILEQSLIQATNQANLLLKNLTVSNQYIDQIITSMADALLVTTLSGKIKKVNPAAQVLLEYSEAELIGQPIFKFLKLIDNLISEPSKIKNIYPWDCHQDLKLLGEVETVCQTKSKKLVPVAFSCSMVQTEIEHLQSYVYIIRDHKC